MIAVLYALPAFAGVNRWTNHWPQDAYPTQLTIDPSNPDVVWAGTSSGVLRSGNGGLTWNDPSGGTLQGVVHCVAIDAETSSVHLGTGSGIVASIDGGKSWEPRLAAHAIYNIVFGSEHTAYAADLGEAGYYYYPAPSTLYKSTDDRASWSGSASTFSFSIMPGTLVVDPSQPLTLLAGTWGGHWGDTLVVQKSVDGGLTWSGVSDGGLALAIDPSNPATIYNGGDGRISKSVDSGSTWTRVGGTDLEGLEVKALAIDPRKSNTVFAGTSKGVLQSTDAGASWRAFNSGLEDKYVYSLAIDRTGTRLHVSTLSFDPNGQSKASVFDYRIFSGTLDVSVGSDNKARLLLTDLENRGVFRIVDGAGHSASAGPFGPYHDWSPTAVADGPDALTRVLWNNADGSAALWLYGAQDNQASYRLGPVSGWTAVDVASGVTGKSHILWIHENGGVGFWAIDNSGRVSYGPKLPADPGWTAVAIADGADGVTRLLWNKVDGSAGLSLVGASGVFSTYRYSGATGWRAVDIAVGADGQSRILWSHANGRMALYRVDSSGDVTASGPVYAAPAGFTAQRISAGPDGHTQVLWTDDSGSALLWQMSADNVFQQSFPAGAN
jgi:hypothetical protein